MSRWLLCVALIAFALPQGARADVPGPRPQCDTTGLTCESCWEHYGADADDKTGFEACAAPLREKGYTEGCRHRQGAGDSVFFCANGAKPPIVTRGGETGCGGCALGADTSSTSLAMILAGLAFAGAVQRRRGR